MINSLTSFSNSAQVFTPFIDRAKTFVAVYGPLSKKIHNCALPYFKAASSFFFCGFGMQEIYQDISKDKNQSLYLKVHGGLLISTGLCGSLEALHAFSIIDLGTLYSSVNAFGGFCFLFANLVALEENISCYEEAKHLESHPKENSKKYSAICGILSNLGYITATLLALFGAPTAIALLIGIMSACCGGLKILYDFLIYSNEVSSKSLFKIYDQNALLL